MFRQRNRPAAIHGHVAAGFETVKDAFAENFSRRGELGAAVAVYHRGEKVVDLWGGTADEASSRPWQEDTLVTVFSATKGVAAACLAMAHSRGWLEYDERVAAYWPAFGQAGKAQITVRQLLSHQAGLCAIDEPLDLDTLADLDTLSEILARQKPAWEPGTKYGYHALSMGWYAGELLRRADPQQRSLGQFLQEEIARPLDMEFYIGLPDEIPGERLATLQTTTPLKMLLHAHQMPLQLTVAYLKQDSLTMRAFTNPRLGSEAYNRRDVLRLEMPASNGTGLVRGLARLYSELAGHGTVLGLRSETLAALQEPAGLPDSIDQVLRVPTAYSLGFLKPSPYRAFGRGSRAFGATGMGGSFAFADPEAGIGFAYAMNRMGYYLRNEPREVALCEAVYRCLEKLT